MLILCVEENKKGLANEKPSLIFNLRNPLFLLFFIQYSGRWFWSIPSIDQPEGKSDVMMMSHKGVRDGWNRAYLDFKYQKHDFCLIKH